MPIHARLKYQTVLAAFAWASFGCLSAHCAHPSASPRPNVLWLIAENIGLDLGCYGTKHVQTPNLDALAVDGLRFTRVFATSPSCAPSRSAFFTGVYQTTTDTQAMRSHRDDDFHLPLGVRPITHWLKDAGYFTANIKTIADKTVGPKIVGPKIVGTGKLDLNFVNEGPIYESDDWKSLRSHQPFFAVVNSPEVEYDIYDRQTFKKDRVEWVGEREHPQIATADNVQPPPYYPDHPLVRQEWARFLNSVSGIDRRIGWVLDRLKADGLADNTIIFFFADNGRLEPRGIHWCYDSGLHVPLIIHWPKNFPAPPQYAAGKTSDQLLSLLDVTATTLATAGVRSTGLMHGRTFLGDVVHEPRTYAFGARDRIDETVQRIRTVRDPKYRYIRNFTPGPTFASLNRYKEKCFPIIPLMRQLNSQGQLTGAAAAVMELRGPSEELYDVETDPYEIHNLTASPERLHQAALTRLRAALDTWIVETGDRGERPEPPGIVFRAAQDMHDWFGTPSWALKNEK